MSATLTVTGVVLLGWFLCLIRASITADFGAERARHLRELDRRTCGTRWPAY